MNVENPTDSPSSSGSRRGVLLAGALAAVTPGAAQPRQSLPSQARGALAGKVAVVTGAARGIGRAIAVLYASEGADIVGLDIAGPVSPVTEYPPASGGDLAETGRQVSASGRRWMEVKADIRDLGALRQAAQRAEREFGGIDILVADAGIQAFAPFLEMGDAEWHDVIDVNLNGTANTLRAFAPALVRRGGGSAILVSSTQGQHGTKHGASYSASKWGIIGLAKSAALDLGEHKVRVNALIPGLIDTPMTRNQRRWKEAVAGTGRTPPATVTEEQAAQAMLPRTPLDVPWLLPEEVAPMALFLAGDGARLVSGGVFAVTAGEGANNLA